MWKFIVQYRWRFLKIERHLELHVLPLKAELHFSISCGFVVRQAVQQNPRQMYDKLNSCRFVVDLLRTCCNKSTVYNKSTATNRTSGVRA